MEINRVTSSHSCPASPADHSIVVNLDTPVAARSSRGEVDPREDPDNERYWGVTRVLAYGVGHVLNDMCASTWFSYLLVFLRQVAHLSPVDSAIVMFWGQIADGFATPLVGVLSDSSKGIKCIGFGRRKTWSFVGVLLVLVCFFFVFASCLPRWFVSEEEEIPRTVMVVYYSLAASLFNCGWAASQVSHMALVPELSKDDNVRCVLNSTRYAFTILSNVLVFVVFFLLLKEIRPYDVPDATKFTYSAYISLLVGGVSSVVFLMGTKEKMPEEEDVQAEVEMHDHHTSKQHLGRISAQASPIIMSPAMADHAQRGPTAFPFDGDLEVHDHEVTKHTSKTHGQELHASSSSSSPGSNSGSRMSWKDWFFEWMFYEVGMVYMCTRLVINVTQVFISFYLIVTLKMSATSIAIVPLLVYLSGFCATFGLRYLNESLGRTGSYCLGSALVIAALCLSSLLTAETGGWIYLFSIVLGMGNSIIMVTSVCLEGDLVGERFESGAFVYGAMSFTDKISNGIAILFIQNEREKLQDRPIEDGEFLRQVYCWLPSVAAILGVLTVLYMQYGSKTIADCKKNCGGSPQRDSNEKARHDSHTTTSGGEDDEEVSSLKEQETQTLLSKQQAPKVYGAA